MTENHHQKHNEKGGSKGKLPSKNMKKTNIKSSENSACSSHMKNTGQRLTDTSSSILSAIAVLQATLNKTHEKICQHDKLLADQAKKFSEQNKQMQDISQKMCTMQNTDKIENLYYDGAGYAYFIDDNVVCVDATEQENAQTQIQDDTVNEQMATNIDNEECHGVQSKRSVCEVDGSNQFHSMTKRFKTSEKCDQEIDTVLANNINELFWHVFE
jgi:hypothetical protein